MKYKAALPWYDFPQTRGTLDLIWSATASQLIKLGYPDIPEALDRNTPYVQQWSDPHSLLNQCCGLDLYRSHCRAMVPIAAPVMTTLDVAPGYYFSHIVKHRDHKLSNQPTLAINNTFSHSGHTSLRRWLADNNHVPGTVVQTGSHRCSAAAVQSGRAEIAAIDAFSWMFVDQSGLQIIGASEPAPAPPFVVGSQASTLQQDIFAALDYAVRTCGDTIGWAHIVPVSRADYQTLEHSARTHAIYPD